MVHVTQMEMNLDLCLVMDKLFKVCIAIAFADCVLGWDVGVATV